MTSVQSSASPQAAVAWLRQRMHGTLRTDSRKVRPGDGFLAWPGGTHDARRYVNDALKAGAAACLVEEAGVDAFGLDGTRVLALPGLKAAAGVVADAYFDAPSTKLDVVAITGTNGKTSSTWWLAQALTALNRRCGVVGTLGVGDVPSVLRGVVQPGDIQSTGMTTPDPVRLQEALAHFVAHGYRACAMEASSIGMEEHRMNGVKVALAVFTNFTQDHLDYHHTMASYWAAKRKLFAWPGLRGAVVNVDDTAGAALASELARLSTGALVTCSAHPVANAPTGSLVARDVHDVENGLCFSVVETASAQGPSTHAAHPVCTSLIGDYNVANLLGVIGVLRLLGVSLQDAAQVCTVLTPVPGRMQRIGGRDEPLIVVDYAHTPDALDKALATLRRLTTQRGGRLVVVFGCGGDRDARKRPLMGRIAAQRADEVVITSDNPRSEDPERIAVEVLHGVADEARRHVHTVLDRRQAVAQTIAQAGASDVVLLAGKGHEDHQDIQGVRHAFSDAVEAQAALALRRQHVALNPSVATVRDARP
jgi:UDP-N-acetylmuramyl-tripeptide synthetase